MMIIYMQVFKVVIFSFWQAKSTEWKQQELYESVEQVNRFERQKYFHNPSFGTNPFSFASATQKKRVKFHAGTSPRLEESKVPKLDLYGVRLLSNDVHKM